MSQYPRRVAKHAIFNDHFQNWYGFEIKKDFYKAATQWLADADKQKDLFAA